jgi:heterodisulfide reductase subunit A
MRLVKMGVAKACLLEPQTEAQSDVIPAALVLGGGIAGMTAALNLARQGFTVHLVEKESRLGGRLPQIGRLCPTDVEAGPLVEPIAEEVLVHPRITLHMPATVASVSGYVGNFKVEIAANEERSVEVGAILVATGAGVLRPEGEYGYGRFPNVITQLEMEERLRSDPPQVDAAVSIHCVGSRIPERPYCSKVCCMTSIKNAMRLKRRNPAARIFVLHRDLLTPGVEFERYYRDAMQAGVRFLRYGLEHPPRIEGNGHAETVVVRETLRGREVRLPVDLVLLTTPLVPAADNERISRQLKAPLGEEGFFLEAHVKLRPVEFAWPADVSETIAQACAAAAKAAIPLRAGKVAAEAITAYSDPGICIGCGTCIQTCPYGAIEQIETEEGRRVAHVTVVQCKGCGCCAAACPNGAMQQRGYTDEQVLRMLEVCGSGD